MKRLLALSAGLGTLAALLAMVGLGLAQDKNDPNKPGEEKTKEQLNKELEGFGTDLSRQLRDLREQMKTIRPVGAGSAPAFSRLGVVLGMPGPVLIDQLSLKEKQGLVVTHVLADSSAARAGLKPNDVLMQFGGRDVPSDCLAFAKMLAEVKAGTPVDALVIRKGKQEPINGIQLPEPKAPPTRINSLPKVGGVEVPTSYLR